MRVVAFWIIEENNSNDWERNIIMNSFRTAYISIIFYCNFDVTGYE